MTRRRRKNLINKYNMGFFKTLGRKLGHAAHSIGKKAGKVVHKAVQYTAEHAGQVADVADKVSGVAGTLATGAAMMGLEPVAAGLAGVAAGAKGVSKVADIAGTAAKTGVATLGAIDAGRQAIDQARIGNVGTAVEFAKAGVSMAKSAKGLGEITKKKIERTRK